MATRKRNSSKATATTNARPIQAYAFVDTNIFLDFYRTGNEASLSLLEKLKAVKDRILSTYQVEMEFLKNRWCAARFPETPVWDSRAQCTTP